LAPIYCVLVDCVLPPSRITSDFSTAVGFISTQFEVGDQADAEQSAIESTKRQMAQKGFSTEEIQQSKFSIEDIEMRDSMSDDAGGEYGFAFY